MKRKEFLILVLIVLTMVTGLLCDTLLLSHIPPNIISRFNDLQDIELVLFQVQATISTLGIALISILSGVSNKSIYGFSIARFILQIRPKLLKHKNITLMLLLIVACNYIFLSFHLYNLMVALLLVTLVLIITMIFEIFTVFEGRDAIKKEIKKYFTDRNTNMDLLDTLFFDSRNAIDSNEVLRYKENMELLIVLFKESTSSISSITKIKDKWEKVFSEVFSDAFTKARGTFLKITYSYFLEVYKIIGSDLIEPNSFVLWDNVNRELFESLKYYDVDNVSDLSVFTSIRWAVYNCQLYAIVDGNERRNNHNLDYFYNRIYYTILSNRAITQILSKSIIDRKLKEYYSNISSDISGSNATSKAVLYNEFRQFVKMLIDQKKHAVLSKTLVRTLYNELDLSLSDDETIHYTTLIIYLYYLLEHSTEAESNEFVRILFSEMQTGISDFLLSISFGGPLKPSMVKSIRKNLDWWEDMPEGEMVTMVLDSIIDQFLIYYSIYTDKNHETLEKSIKSIIEERIFSYVNDYSGNRKTTNYEKYKKYVKTVFNSDISDVEVEEDFIRLENVLYNVYRSVEVEKGKERALSCDQIEKYKHALQSKINDKINDEFKIFDRSSGEFTLRNSIKKVKIETYSNFIESTIDQIDDCVFNFFVAHVIKVMIQEEKIDYDEVFIRDKTALNSLFGKIETNNILVDTILGYRNWLHGFEREIDFRKLEEESNKIKAKRISDIILCIDSSKVYIRNIDVSVKIDNMEFGELVKSLEQDKEGRYLYNITNDIYLSFQLDELESFVSDTRKIISIEVSFDYAFEDKILGAAVIFKTRNKIEESLEAETVPEELVTSTSKESGIKAAKKKRVPKHNRTKLEKVRDYLSLFISK